MHNSDPFRPKGSGPLIATSAWFQMQQDMFTSFETLTLSNDPLHMDPEWVTQHTHYSSTIAPGFLSLALLPYLGASARIVPEGFIGINYGFNKVRWVAPVPVGSDVRARFYDGGRTERTGGTGGYTANFLTILEIRDLEQPGMVAEWLVAVLPDAASGVAL